MALEQTKEMRPLHVVVMFPFDVVTSLPLYENKVIFRFLHEKLRTHSAVNRLGYIDYSMVNNNSLYEIREVNQDLPWNNWHADACTENMAWGLPKAHELIGNDGLSNGIILLFSDGKVHTGDYFDGVEGYKSQVPVHTFTLGAEDANISAVLRTIAGNSPGGEFHPVPVAPNNDASLSEPFKKVLESIILSATTSKQQTDEPPVNELAMASFNDDDEEPPTTPSNAVEGNNKEGLVTMTIPTYSKKDVALTSDSVTAVVELKATSSAAVREGLDLVAVVDVSGSMDGEKIKSVRRALQFVIMKLTPVDRLSIVTFESAAKRINPLLSMTLAAQDKLKEHVGNLKARGGTDIKAGLELGLAVLAGRVHTESRTANIFLMSDGKVEGGDDPTKTNPGEVPVYTFGFGRGTDHKLLTAIAMKSVGGTYSSVPDGTNLSDPFARLLGGLLTVVAQDVQLSLKPKNGDLDKMVVVPGTDYTLTTDDKGTVTIKFGTLFSGETRKVAVNFALKASTKTRPYNAILAVAQHSYAAQETRQLPQNILRRRTPNPSSPATAVIEEQWVQAEVARRNYAGFISEANDLADEATRMANEATIENKDGSVQKVVDEAKMAEAWKKLEDAQKKLEEAQDEVENIMLDDDEKMVNTLRAELVQLVAYMQSHDLYDQYGRPYALATITSHYRQRTAGRGDPEIASCLYVTPRMITCIQQAKKFEKNQNEPVPNADQDVKEEIAQNPLAAIAAPLTFYLDNAIQALQAIQKLVATAST